MNLLYFFAGGGLSLLILSNLVQNTEANDGHLTASVFNVMIAFFLILLSQF